MKKVGLLLLALVVVMGSLGVGYAMWSDTITLNGTVQTGTVSIDVTGVSSTYIWKMNDGTMAITNSNVPPTGVPYAIDAFPNDDVSGVSPVAYAAALEGGTGDADVEFYYNNLFPLEAIAGTTPLTYDADFTATYNGSIPVHVAWDWALVDDSGTLIAPGAIPAGAIKELMYYYATISYVTYNAGGTQTGSGSFAPSNNALIQLHQGDKINFKVSLELPQTWYKNVDHALYGQNTQDTLSDIDFKFVGKFIAYQWNETAPTVNLTDVPQP